MSAAAVESVLDEIRPWELHSELVLGAADEVIKPFDEGSCSPGSATHSAAPSP